MAACALAVSLLVIVLWGWFGATPDTRTPGGDFEVRYLAAQRWLAGQPVYTRDPLAYANPPFFLLAFVPLTALPYGAALALWQALSAAAYLAALLLTLRALGWRPRGSDLATLLVLACAALPPVVCILVGQQSTLVLLALALGFWLERRHPFAAGLALAGAGIKPHFVAFPALWLLATRRWPALAGLALGGAALGLLSLAMVGLDGLRAFLDVVRFFSGRIATEERERWDMHTLYAALHQWLQGAHGAADVIYWALLAAAVAALVALWASRSTGRAVRALRPRGQPCPCSSVAAPQRRVGLGFAMAVVAGCLLGPYVHLYDLATLLLPYLASARWLLDRRPSPGAPAPRRWQALLAALAVCYPLPFLNLFAARQLTAYGMAFWMAALGAALLSGGRSSAAATSTTSGSTDHQP